MNKLCSSAHATSETGAPLGGGGGQQRRERNILERRAAADGTCMPELHDTGLPAAAQDDDVRASACDRCAAAVQPLDAGDAAKAFKT